MTQHNFEIVTDSSANLTDELIDRYGIHIIPLVYIVNGEEKLSYVKGEKTDLKKYYGMMREKVPMTTSCASRENCERVFEEILGSGKDLLYIGFSSALSATFDNAKATLNELTKKYKERKIFYVDSLGASMGEGRLVTYAAERREDGESIDDVCAWVEDNKNKLAHLFTVENLAYLYRGGRVKKSAYLLASTLNIKPVMHVDDMGRLIPIGKVFGRKKSLADIANRLAELIVEPEKQTIYISHGDCIEDVEFLISQIKERVTVKDFVINYVDLVVGTHSGPGTVAVFFLGKNK